jgi:hypothetical protein
MRLIKKILFCYLIVFFLTLIIQSCCHDRFRIIGNGEIGAYTDYYNPGNKIDTVKGAFLINWNLELKTTSLINNISLFQSCYATGCAQTFENEIVDSSFTISCNKDFKYNGLLIAAETDFSDLDKIVIYIEKKWGGVEIQFSKDFLDLTDFDKCDYEFKVNIKTTDNIYFENKLKVNMDLK